MVEEARLNKVKAEQKAIDDRLQDLAGGDRQAYNLQAELLRLKGEESSLKHSLYRKRVDIYQFALVPELQDDGQLHYQIAGKHRSFHHCLALVRYR